MHWELHPTPLLALLIVLDQFPRILHRGMLLAMRDHVLFPPRY